MERKRVGKRTGPKRPAKRAPTGGALMRPGVTDALTKALFAEWARVGYGALSLETVAKRARVGKAALYRRWPSKQAMAADRLKQIETELTALPEIRDTGSLEGDIKALLVELRGLYEHRLMGRILGDIESEMLRSPELASAVRAELQTPFVRNATTILERAVQRGEMVPDHNVDLEVAADALIGILHWRMLGRGAQLNDKYLDGVVQFITKALMCIEIRVAGEGGARPISDFARLKFPY